MPSRQPASTKTGPANDRQPSVARSPETADALSGLQHAVGNQAVTQMLAAQAVQAKLRIGAPGDRFEQEADRIAEQVVGVDDAVRQSPPQDLHAAPAGNVQRKCAECEEEEEQTLRRSPLSGADDAVAEPETSKGTPASDAVEADAPAADDASTDATRPAVEATSATALVVEDDAADVGPGQMRKTQFLSALRDAVCGTANEGLAAAGQTTEACPWVEYWFNYAAEKDASYVERALNKYAPESAGAATAGEYVAMIAARVRQSVDVWVQTGQVTGVPEELAGVPMGPATAGTTGGVMLKARPGGRRDAGDAASIRNRLGSGRPLDGSVRGRMESAFGRSFSKVRVHTDADAARVSDQLNARAFTVGEHVAFGASEYRPGTMMGDALLAHELAHVVQQGSAAPATQAGSEADASTLERDADRSALGAVASLWASAKSAIASVSPRATSGLRLSRCSKTTATATPVTLGHRTTTAPTDEGCGGYTWATQWSVNNASASTNGFIVQKLIFDLQRQICAGGANNFSKTYWEAWEVRGGNVYVGTSANPHNADRFHVGATPGQKGVNIEEGYAKYIDGYTAPATWGNVREAGDLPATEAEPAGWTNDGTFHRKIKNEFDCCPPKNESHLTTEES
jgi:hypothetical protein